MAVKGSKTKLERRISPKEVSNFKNKETTQASKAVLKLNSLKRAGKKSNHITFNNTLKDPKIKVNTESLKRPKNSKEVIKAQQGTYNKNKKASVTPGLPLKKTNKIAKGARGQQERELLNYQRKTHAKILSTQMPKAGYISPGKGGKPSHTWRQPGKPKKAVNAINVGVKPIGKVKKKK